jgi:GT2 family glycosyltransferase
MGFLVEALRKQNIETFGRDISRYAISQALPSLQPYCAVGSISDPIEGTYDLVTCIEVLEHMPAADGRQAIRHLCSAAPLILFSSSPRDVTEPTHVNVREPLHWLKLFAEEGFGPRADHDPSYVAPWAMLLAKRVDHPSEAELIAYARLVAARMERAELLSERERREQAEVRERARLTAELLASRQDAEHLSTLLREAQQQADKLAQLEWRLQDAQLRLRAFETSTIWRATAPVRALAHSLPALRRILGRRPSSADLPDPYQAWIDRYDTITPVDLAQMRAKAKSFASQPLVSIVMPTYNTPQTLLREAIDSVLAQTYDNWELCIADDASPEPHMRAILEAYAQQDARIKVAMRESNGHISASSNSALALASGEWIALLDHDDLLAPHALFCMIDAINRQPNAALLYSDEDKIDIEGRRSDPYFKPDWNTALFLGQNMFSHFGVVRSDLVQAVGGFRLGYEGSQDYDLVLRCIERVEISQIVHVPQVLYHWRMIPGSTALQGSEKPYTVTSALKALNDHYERTNVRIEAVSASFFGGNRPLPALEKQPSVAIIIPTRDGLDVLRPCVESILSKTSYRNYKIYIVDNRSSDPDTLAYLESKSKSDITIIDYDHEFNYSAINNFAASQTQSDYLLFLNNDTEIVSPGWIEEMVGLAECLPQTGVVGARLLYPDRTVQHAGVIVGLGGVAGHYCHFPEDSFGYFGRAALVQNYSAVTFACALVKRSIFTEVGGLDEVGLKVAFNDVDFCLKVGEAGYRNVWTPNATLLHFESKTRGAEDSPVKMARFASEVALMKDRWGEKLTKDSNYSPNLSLDSPFTIAFPPRARKPWHV